MVTKMTFGDVFGQSSLRPSPSFFFNVLVYFSSGKYQNMEKPLKHQRRLRLTWAEFYVGSGPSRFWAK